MRKTAPLIVLAIPISFTAQQVSQVSIDQLIQTIASRQAARASDTNLARHIAALHLTDRLTPARLDEISAQLKPGPETAQALALLADASAFLSPPASELPDQAAPTVPAQQAMMNAAVSYVGTTFQRLPNFLATRLTRSFDDAPLVVTHSGWAPSNTDLHLAGTFEQEITYRGGREASLRSASTTSGNARQGASPPGLTSSGEFGPILITVLVDISKGKVAWSHWEKTSTGTSAVFSYQVPVAASHYRVEFCCVHGSAEAGGLAGNAPPSDAAGPDANSYRGMPAYHGTLAIDPATGAILRLTVDPELNPDGPIQRSAIAVDYAPVDIGGNSYICPVQSVALSLAHIRLGGDMSDRTIFRINEVRFTNYHRFGSSSRIVSTSN